MMNENYFNARETAHVEIETYSRKQLEECIISLYESQTEDEQDCSGVRESNGRGFNYDTVELGTEFAKWFLEGGQIESAEEEVECRRIVKKHWRQIVKASEVVRAVSSEDRENAVKCLVGVLSRVQGMSARQVAEVIDEDPKKIALELAVLARAAIIRAQGGKKNRTYLQN